MTRSFVFICLQLSLLLLASLSSEAQQLEKIPRIGYAASGGDSKNPGYIVAAFRRGLQDLGYVEGKNILVEYRYPGADPRDLREVAELLQLKVDVLVSSSAGAIRAAKQATQTIPIVMMASFDPVKTGIIEVWRAPAEISLESPGSRMI